MNERARKRRFAAFGLITLVFIYTTLLNVYERPVGFKIAVWFIGAMILLSLVSRVMRSTELRIQGVQPDDAALGFIRNTGGAPVRILAIRPGDGRKEAYEKKMNEARESHNLPQDEGVLFLEIRPSDVSDFTGALEVTGIDVGGYKRAAIDEPGHPERDCRRCCCTSGTRQDSCRTRTSGGPKAIRSSI